MSNATAGIIEDAELPGIELVDLGTHRLKGLPREQRLFQVTVEGLPSRFDRPRTGETRTPGAGTFLLTDLMGYRHVIRALGDEESTSLAAEYQAIVSAVIERGDGIVLERAGDSVLAVFADAGNAIRAGAAIRTAAADLVWPPGFEVIVSIAIHSGRWSGDPDRIARADHAPQARAPRVEARARPGARLAGDGRPRRGRPRRVAATRAR